MTKLYRLQPKYSGKIVFRDKSEPPFRFEDSELYTNENYVSVTRDEKLVIYPVGVVFMIDTQIIGQAEE